MRVKSLEEIKQVSHTTEHGDISGKRCGIGFILHENWGIDSMEDFCGQIVEVEKRATASGVIYYRGNMWNWAYEWLSPISKVKINLYKKVSRE